MEYWTAVKLVGGHWLFSWDADSLDTFDIWLNGRLLEQVTGGEYESEVSGYDETPPPLEIVSTVAEAESEQYPPFAILQWRESEGASSYFVEQYVNGSWIYRKTIPESGAGYYWYRTPMLGDGVAEQWRVSALTSKGVAGTPITFSFVLARNPDPPEVSLEVNSSGELVVDEA